MAYARTPQPHSPTLTLTLTRVLLSAPRAWRSDVSKCAPACMALSGVLRHGEAHDPIACARAAEVELPKQALVFSKSFMARLKAVRTATL